MLVQLVITMNAVLLLQVRARLRETKRVTQNWVKEVKKQWPDRAVIASLMVPLKEESWKKILMQVEDTGCDGVELNFGCPKSPPP